MTLRTVIALCHGSMAAFEQRHVDEEQSTHCALHVHTAALIMLVQHNWPFGLVHLLSQNE